MKTNNGKTVFVEYSSSNKGQHFMTVIQTRDHRRIIIGRIYREYDKENKKTNYLATDFEGNQVFVDIKDLPTLKKKFIEHGPSLATFAPKAPGKSSQNEKLASHLEKNNELKNIRDKKVGNEKTKETSKENFRDKRERRFQLEQVEKEMDAKNAEKAKDNEKAREQNEQQIENELEIQQSPDEQTRQEDHPVDDQFSEREAELDSIRDQDDEIEQDIER